VFHPGVLDLPFLPHFKESAKLSYILAIERSSDPLIAELHNSLLISDSYDVPMGICNALSAAKTSVSNIHSATFAKVARNNLKSSHVGCWNPRLTVQNKFLDIVKLEQACPLWRRLMFGLPEKQLSFLLHAGCDTLPTPMNLARWNIIVNPVCALCRSPQPTSNHVLTSCPVALDQGGTPGVMTQCCSYLFAIFRKFCFLVISSLLISPVILQVLALLAPFHLIYHLH